MKFLFQLIFFIVAVVLTVVSVIVVVIVVLDSRPQGLYQLPAINSYDFDDWATIFSIIAGSSSIAVVIYFILWKTNFFSRNK